MKHNAVYILLIALLVLPVQGLYAQRIAFSSVNHAIDGQTLSLNIAVEATGFNVSSCGGYRLEVAVEGENIKLVLPGIEYLSRLGTLYEKRRSVFSDAPWPKPHRVFSKVKPSETYLTQYEMSVPYYQWMQGGYVSYVLYGYHKDGMTAVAEGIITHLEDENPNQNRGGGGTDDLWSMILFADPGRTGSTLRSEKLRLDLAFPEAGSAILPQYENNTAVLAGLDKTLVELLSEEKVHIEDIYITTYGAPDGTFTDNERITRARAQAVGNYMRGKYPLNGIPVGTSNVPEDWDGLVQAIEADSGVPHRDRVQSVIMAELHRDPDTREWLLKTIDERRPYQYLLERLYPTLRRTEIEFRYSVGEYTPAQARSQLFTRPERLSPGDIYTAAMGFDEENNRMLAWEMALKLYPDDPTGHINMAASLLREGKPDQAFEHLKQVSDDPRAWVNIGVYYFKGGDMIRAQDYFSRASGAGIEKGGENLRMIQQ